MSTITQTVTDSMNSNGYGHYGRYATPVVEALTEREYGIADSLIQFAVSQGLSADDAKAAVQQAGMEVRPEPEPEPVADASDDSTVLQRIEATVNTLAQRLDSAASQAARHGIRF